MVIYFFKITINIFYLSSIKGLDKLNTIKLKFFIILKPKNIN